MNFYKALDMGGRFKMKQAKVLIHDKNDPFFEKVIVPVNGLDESFPDHMLLTKTDFEKLKLEIKSMGWRAQKQHGM